MHIRTAVLQKFEDLIVFSVTANTQRKRPNYSFLTLNTQISQETDALVRLDASPRTEMNEHTTNVDVTMHQTRSWRGVFLIIYME